MDDINKYFFVLLDKNWENMQLKGFGCSKGASISEHMTPTPLLQYDGFDLHILCVLHFCSQAKCWLLMLTWLCCLLRHMCVGTGEE